MDKNPQFDRKLKVLPSFSKAYHKSNLYFEGYFNTDSHQRVGEIVANCFPGLESAVIENIPIIGTDEKPTNYEAGIPILSSEGAEGAVFMWAQDVYLGSEYALKCEVQLSLDKQYREESLETLKQLWQEVRGIEDHLPIGSDQFCGDGKMWLRKEGKIIATGYPVLQLLGLDLEEKSLFCNSNVAMGHFGRPRKKRKR